MPPSDRRPLVLVVEDDEDTNSLYAEVLHYYGFDAIAVTHAERAFALALERRPDVMAVDVGLPDVDGLQLLARLKADARLKTIPVVCVTGYVQHHVRERAMHHGCAVFIEKPCTPQELAEALRLAIARQRSDA